MTTPTPSTALVPAASAFTTAERLALAGFLAGYTGLTRQGYELDRATRTTVVGGRLRRRDHPHNYTR